MFALLGFFVVLLWSDSFYIPIFLFWTVKCVLECANVLLEVFILCDCMIAALNFFTDFYKDSWLTVSFESEKRAGMLLFSSKSLPNSLVLGR